MAGCRMHSYPTHSSDEHVGIVFIRNVGKAAQPLPILSGSSLTEEP